MESLGLTQKEAASWAVLGFGSLLASRVLPQSMWKLAAVGGGLAVAAPLTMRYGKSEKLDALSVGLLGAFVGGLAAREFLTQPGHMLSAFRERDAWKFLSGVRRSTFAFGMVVPASVAIWKMADGFYRGKAEARDVRSFVRSGNVWSLYQPFQHVDIWMRKDDREFQQAVVAQLRARGSLISFDTFLERLKIPNDITEKFGEMTSTQIRDLILKTDERQLPVGNVARVLEEQGRTHVLVDMFPDFDRLGEYPFADFDQRLAALQAKESGVSPENEAERCQLLETLRLWLEGAALGKSVQKRLGGIAEEPISGLLGRVQEVTRAWDKWVGDSASRVMDTRNALNRLNFVEAEDEEADEDAINMIYPHMNQANYPMWEGALGIASIADMDEKLDQMGLAMKSDLVREGVWNPAVNAESLAANLMAYRERWEKGQKSEGGLTGAVVGYMSEPSKLKSEMGPFLRKMLKVAGSLAYVGIWATCMAAHATHARNWFLAGAAIAVGERLFWGKEFSASDLPNGRYARGEVALVQGAMYAEQLQAAWLDDRDSEVIAREGINCNLWMRSTTFGGRGFVAQSRVLASETGLSALYSVANYWATPASLRRLNNELSIGTTIIGRSCANTLIDTMQWGYRALN